VLEGDEGEGLGLHLLSSTTTSAAPRRAALPPPSCSSPSSARGPRRGASGELSDGVGRWRWRRQAKAKRTVRE